MFRSKYLAKMQQGGGLSVSAPNPQPYRAPLQGLNPNVFQYDVRTQPLDTSNLIQVMQTKDTMDLKRQQAALEREKMKAEADLAKMKFEHQKAKAQMDFSMDMMDKFGKFDGLNNPIPFEDYTMSARYKTQYEPIVNDLRAAEEDVFKTISTMPIGDKMLMPTINEKLKRVEIAKKRLIPLEQFKVDQSGRDKIAKIQSDPSGDLQVYGPSLMRVEDKRQRFYNGVEDNGYNMDYVTDPTIWYSQKTEAEKLKETFKVMNTPQPITSFNTDPSGENEFNQYVQVDKKNFVPKADKAAELMADKILADPKQTSYISSMYGIDFHDPSVSLDIKKKNLKEILQPQLEFDDDLLRSKSNSYRITQTSPKPKKDDVNINYNIKGKSYEVKKSYEGEADINFNYSGTGAKAGATKKEKEQFESQVANNTAKILQDNNIKNTDKKMIDRIADAVSRTASKYPNLTDYASNDVIQKAWSDAIDNYNALPSDKKTDRALDIEFEKALKTNYEIDLTEVGKKNEEMNEYERLAKNLKSTSTWQDLKKSDSPLVKDSKGNLKPDNQLQLIFSAIRSTAAQLNMGKTDLNAAPPSVKSQLQNKKGSFNLSEYYPQN